MEDVRPITPGDYRLQYEPHVRIGVVLAEDGKQEIEFSVPGPGYCLMNGTGPGLQLAAEQNPITLRATGGDGISATDGQGKVLVARGNGVRLLPPVNAKPQNAGDGVLVRGIVAGRGFHWFKLIDQHLSDVLDFSARDGVLIMVNELPLETYLVGVITGEMSGDCPVEFLKAQATAARSWLLGQRTSPHPNEPFFWCNDDDCQRYQGTGGWSDAARRAVAECRGMVLVTEANEYCDARYSKSTGGVSEDAISCWPAEKIDGLLARVDAPADDAAQRFLPVTEENLREYLEGDWIATTGAFASPNVVPEETITKYLGRVDEGGEYFRWRKSLTQASLLESLATRGGIADIARVMDLRPGTRGRSGRLETLHVDYLNAAGERKTHTIVREYYIRAALDKKFLYSSCFAMDITRESDGAIATLDLIGAGWGHGAGLCQIGGLGRALKGQSYDEILLHYYSDVRLVRIYE